MMPELLIIRDEDTFRKNIEVEEMLDFINSLVEEEALILRNSPVFLEEEKRWYESISSSLEKESLVLVVLLDGKRIAGNCEARKKSGRQSHNVEFGLAIRREYRGKGYGELLLKTAIKEAKHYLKAVNMWISYIEGNEPAKRLYEKLGFREVCRLREYSRVKNSLRDEVIMKLFE